MHSLREDRSGGGGALKVNNGEDGEEDRSKMASGELWKMGHSMTTSAVWHETKGRHLEWWRGTAAHPPSTTDNMMRVQTPLQRVTLMNGLRMRRE